MLHFGLVCVILININYGVIIPATSSNGTHEYYDTKETDYFQFDTINCATSYCQVNCDTANGCYGLTINAQLSQSLIINCLKDASCEKMTVYAINIFKYGCNSAQSCKNSIILLKIQCM